MLRTIHLHGRLGRLFGKLHKLEIATAAEAVRAFNCLFPRKFMQELQKGSYEVIRGHRKTGLHLKVDDLNTFNLGRGELHIVPVIEGAKSGSKKGGGALKSILGILIVGAAIFFSGGTLAAPLAGMNGALQLGSMSISWGNIAVFGLAATLAGASTMLTAQEKPKQSDALASDSFSVNGPGSTYDQGKPIPIICGLQCIVGAEAISISNTIGDIPLGPIASAPVVDITGGTGGTP